MAELRSPESWLQDPEFHHLIITKPTGWNQNTSDWEAVWAEPITREEMWRRLIYSTTERKSGEKYEQN
jgi:hypothetical protein